MSALRKVNGLIFECPSPSIWNLVGGNAMLAYTGQNGSWSLSYIGRDGSLSTGQYPSRQRALDCVAQIYGKIPNAGADGFRR